MTTVPTFPSINIADAQNVMHTIRGAATSITAFVGRTPRGPINKPIAADSFSDLAEHFGGLANDYPLPHAVKDFFANGGTKAIIVRTAFSPGDDVATFIGQREAKTGLYALESADTFNLLCIPPLNRSKETPLEIYHAALKYCCDRRAMLLIDAPLAWSSQAATISRDIESLLATYTSWGIECRNAAMYFPWLVQQDSLDGNQLCNFAPSGAVAGIIARTDTTRGVWKAPAGLDASIKGINSLSTFLNDPQNESINSFGINCLRLLPQGLHVVWGSRTLRGGNHFADEFKYIPVRRTALFIEESIVRSSQWTVFEPNGERLWSHIRSSVQNFMTDLFRQGAFQGSKVDEAYFIRCDRTTMTQSEIERGIVNLMIGFAPLKPAEFVIIRLQLAAAVP